MTTPNFVYNLWVLDSYGKKHLYTQCASAVAIDKRAKDFAAVYPKEKYLSLYITMLPYAYRLLAWEYELWDDYHEKYIPLVATTTKAKKKRTPKKKTEEKPAE